LGVRAGKIKLPVGLYNETRDLDAARTGIFLPQSVYAEAYREALVATQGVALYGRIPLGPLGTLPYQLLAGSVSFPPGGATETTFNAIIGGPMTIKPSSNVPNFTAYIEWETPIDGLRLAFSELYTHWDQTGQTNVAIPTATGLTIPAGTPVHGSISSLHLETYSAEFIWRNLTLAGEYIRRRPKMEMSLDLTKLGAGTMPLPMELTSEDGFYVSVSYRLKEWLEVGTYYAAQYGNATTHSTEGVNDYNKDIDLSLRFDLPGGFIVKAEAHKMYGAKGVIYDMASNERDWWFFAGKASFSF
jgi:hypothetical protein